MNDHIAHIVIKSGDLICQTDRGHTQRHSKYGRIQLLFLRYRRIYV